MKLEFEKVKTVSPDGIGKITEIWRIFVDIVAIPKVEEKIAYAVQNMAYSLGYKMTKKEKQNNELRV